MGGAHQQRSPSPLAWARSCREPVVGSRARCGGGVCCTTRRHDAQRTEERELLYPWHPWFGRRVLVHEVIVKEERRILRCGLTPEAVRRWLEVPDWMFEEEARCALW